MDAVNFERMARLSPGSGPLQVVVAVSAARPFTETDRLRVARLVAILERSPHICGVTVIFKGNVGRDFSSAYACLREISRSAAPDDVVMVKNRSGYGPLKADWFGAYARLLSSRDDLGMVGSTINFVGLDDRPRAPVMTHVQTYAYVSHWSDLAAIVDRFPAIDRTDRVEVIEHGEIGLSRMILESGRSIACLAWPTHRFTLERPTDPELPHYDVKKCVWKALPIRYRFDEYERYNWLSRAAWFIRSRWGKPSSHSAHWISLKDFGPM
jgi:hypothetical protein